MRLSVLGDELQSGLGDKSVTYMTSLTDITCSFIFIDDLCWVNMQKLNYIRIINNVKPGVVFEYLLRGRSYIARYKMSLSQTPSLPLAVVLR